MQLAFQKLAGSSAKWEGASSLSPFIYTPSSPWSSSILSHRPGMLLVISLPQSQSVDRKQFSPSVLLVLVTSTSLQAVLSASSTSWPCSPGHLSHSSSPSRPLALPPCRSLSSSRPSVISPEKWNKRVLQCRGGEIFALIIFRMGVV